MDNCHIDYISMSLNLKVCSHQTEDSFCSKYDFFFFFCETQKVRVLKK